MRVYVVRKSPLWGRSRSVCWNITRVSLWLLCNVHLVQSANWVSMQAGTAEDDDEGVRASFLHSPKNQRELQLKSYRRRKQQCGVFYVSVWSFLVINVCNHEECYETPCTIFFFFILSPCILK
jgi:hypothetical protein